MSQLITIAILNWNGKHLLEKNLPFVINYTPKEEAAILVIDNGSSDGSVDWLKNKYPEVDLLCFEKNYGYAEGYNRAVKEIKTPYLCLLNSDVEPSSNWIKKPLELFLKDPKIVAIQPKIKDYYKRDFFEYAGAAGGFIDSLGYPYCRGRIFDAIEKDYGQYNQQIPIFWASGACLFVRRADFLKVGGFDVNFFAHMEEIDLAWRLQKNQGKIIFTPESEVFHMGGASLNKGNSKKVYLNFRNNFLMLYKNLTKTKFIFKYIVRFFLDFLVAFSFLIKGEPASFRAIPRAHLDFWKMREKYKVLVKNETKNLGKKSIIWSYFILRRRKFSEF